MSSKAYTSDKPAQVFILLGKAREEIKEGNLSKAISLYLKSYRIARTIPHPTGILNSLNDAGWYLKEIHPRIALPLAEEAVYQAGWFREDVESVFYLLDTLFEIEKTIKSEQVCETAEVILSTEKSLPPGAGKGTKECYCKTNMDCQRFKLDLSISSYENSRFLRSYLKRHIKSITSTSRTSGVDKKHLSLLLRGKIKTIKGETLRKLIKGIKFKIDLQRDPAPIVAEGTKIKLEERYLEATKKLGRIPPQKRVILFLSTFMSLLDRKEEQPYLTRKDKLREALRLCQQNLEAFSQLMAKRWETRKFVLDMTLKIHPLLERRRELTKIFLSRLTSERREWFIEVYINLEEDQRKLMDTFIRNYVRYNRSWGVKIPLPEELKMLTRNLHLKETPTALAFFSFEMALERRRFCNSLPQRGEGTQ